MAEKLAQHEHFLGMKECTGTQRIQVRCLDPVAWLRLTIFKLVGCLESVCGTAELHRQGRQMLVRQR